MKRGLVFRRSSTAQSQRSGAPELPNFCGSPLSMTTLFKKNNKIGRGHKYGEWLVLGGEPRPHSQWGLAIAYPNCAGPPLLMRTQLDLERPNSAW